MLLPKFDLDTRFVPIIENLKKPKFDNAVEGLRGLAALWVCCSHAINDLDRTYQPASIFGHLFVGREAVWIFFVLSGYVIGITSTEEFSNKNAYSYLLKRGIRIIPMYLLAIAISYLVLPIDSGQIIVGNILFLQNLIVPVISANRALWSLNYEVIYYLVFLIIWRLRPKISSMFIGIATSTILIWIFNPLPDIWAGYLAGWIFWLLGLFFAWRVPSNAVMGKVPLLSILLLFFANKELRLGANILDVLHLNNPGEAATFGDLAFLPICWLLFAVVANRAISGNIYRFVSAISLLMPFAVVSYGFIKNRGFRSDNYAIAAVEIFLAILFYWVKTSPSILRYFTFWGSISYGIYIFHSPLIYFIRDNFFVAGNGWSYGLRFFVWAVLAVSLSFLMDVKLQPNIRNWFRKHVSVK
jgi:peptidoglycan/LPS O-acetylase OafA/YrhL